MGAAAAGATMGFRLEQARAPVRIWQGITDSIVPPAMARRLAAGDDSNARPTMLPLDVRFLVGSPTKRDHVQANRNDDPIARRSCCAVADLRQWTGAGGCGRCDRRDGAPGGGRQLE